MERFVKLLAHKELEIPKGKRATVYPSQGVLISVEKVFKFNFFWMKFFRFGPRISCVTQKIFFRSYQNIFLISLGYF
jgi:hypothetical protein